MKGSKEQTFFLQKEAIVFICNMLLDDSVWQHHVHLLSTLSCLKCGGIFASIHPEVIIVITPKFAN